MCHYFNDQFFEFFRGQIEYSVKESCLQDSPPAAGRFSDIIPLRLHAAHMKTEGFIILFA